MKAHLVKIFHVEAAHHNPAGNDARQRLHGHSYKIEILASGTPSSDLGWVVDYGDIKRAFAEHIHRLDHAYLNEIPGLEDDTTLSAVARWVEAGVEERPAWLDGVRVSIAGDLAYQPVRLAPDPFRGLPARIRFTFEAAQSLPQLPVSHPCYCIHGHSYRVEVGAEDLAALDMELRYLYDVVDHRFLNEVDGLNQATCEHICAWMWDWLARRGVQPAMTLVQETDSAQSIYFGEQAEG